MMKLIVSILSAIALLMTGASTGHAGDQLVLGNAFILANPGLPKLRAASASALEGNSTATIVGDPTQPGSAGGAILELIANGGAPSSQTFNLPQGTRPDGKPFWTAQGSSGFTYTDLTGAQGPVSLVVIKRALSGRFSIQAAAVGTNGVLEVVPPNPGTDAFMTLKL